MKPIIQRIGLLIAMLSAFLSASAYDFEVDGIYYNIVSISDFTCEVTKGDSKYTGDVVIPPLVTYNSREIKVIAIGDYAFDGCSSLTSVTIPNSVETIGKYAFYDCSSLTSMIIPNSVTYIGSDAFDGCSSLTSVTIPNSVETIGKYAFYDCSSLTSVTIPNSVTSIGSYAFQGCSSLTSVTIPNFVETIGESAFKNCSSLTSVTISNSVTSMKLRVFENCTSLSSVKLGTGLKKLEEKAFYGCDSLKSLTVPGNISSWYENSFPNGILEMSFEYGKALKNLTIPKSVEKLSIYRDFDNVAKLTNLKEYIMGEHVTKNALRISESSKLESITCIAVTPPSLNCTPSNAQYMNLKVYVPEESLELYKKADGWKSFWNLQVIRVPDSLSNAIDMEIESATASLNQVGNVVISNFQNLTAESFATNAKCPEGTQDGFTSWDVLIDNNTSTYFHSNWHGADSDDGLDHWISIDLGEPMNDFNFSYTTRDDISSALFAPTKIQIQGSNNFVDWDDIIRLSGNLPTARCTTYTSPDITFSQPYRYVRLMVLSNSENRSAGGHPYFVLSELSVNNEKYDVIKNNGYQDVADEILLSLFKAIQEAQQTKQTIDIVKINSVLTNLKSAHQTLLDAIEKTTYLDEIEIVSDVIEIGRFDLYGRPVNKSFKGLTIVRYSDGSARKEVK